MELHQLLNMLQGVSGPNASGEYTAKCPAHQDRTASLTACAKASPKDGKEKIYLCCHAGCTGSDIMAALGISAKDLIVNPDPDRPAAGGRSSGKAKGKGRGTAGTVPAVPAGAERTEPSPCSPNGRNRPLVRYGYIGRMERRGTREEHAGTRGARVWRVYDPCRSAGAVI